MATSTTAEPSALGVGVSGRLTLVFATGCGLLVANLYFAQPLAEPISSSIGLTPATAGLTTTLTQAGYALGLLLLAPRGDLLENRRLVVSIVAVGAAALAIAALSTSALPLLLASLLVGACTVSAQIRLPYAAHLAPERERGHMVGKVMSGLLLGIMLCRPAASLLTSFAGWHAVY